jgi:Na+-translocating ferredoxin:NAD+ oxidoreductase RnfG subunit
MYPLEEEEQEPVAVVRTLSDFALALTLVVLMLIGSRSVAGNRPAAKAQAAESQSGSQTVDLNLLLLDRARFKDLDEKRQRQQARTAGSLAQAWAKARPGRAAAVVVQFPRETLATDLHEGLLELQTAFGTNLARIETLPEP